MSKRKKKTLKSQLNLSAAIQWDGGELEEFERMMGEAIR
jgi:hypothetical protein